MKVLKTSLLLLAIVAFPLTGFGQRARNVSGKAVYYPPEDMGLAEAKAIAVERAREQAIADAFGTVISQATTVMIQEDGEQSSQSTFNTSGSDIKGEWLEDTREPEVSVGNENNVIYIVARVFGRAREIKASSINLDIKVLRNGIDETRFEDTRFKTGDRLFLHFASPVDGYLAVYLVDTKNNAFCLLPYKLDSDGRCNIRANTAYKFFDRMSANPENRYEIDEYTLYTDGRFEQNLLYVIFSPNPFTKPLDVQGSAEFPRQLGFAAFQKWLTRCRTADKDMSVKLFNLSVYSE